MESATTVLLVLLAATGLLRIFFRPVPRPHRVALRRKRPLPLLLLAALLFSVPAFPSAASVALPSGRGNPDRLLVAGGKYAVAIAAHEMHQAVIDGSLERVEAVLSYWPGLIDARNDDGMTPLFLAAAFDRHEIAILLLDRGADMHAANRHGAMPFHQAAFSGHGRIVELLLDRGEDVDVRDRDDRTGLHLSAWKNQWAITRLLVERGAQVDAADGVGGGATPLHYAAALGSADVARVLLEHCANADAMMKGGSTPMQLALSLDRPEIVRLLLAHDPGKGGAGGQGVTTTARAGGEGAGEAAGPVRKAAADGIAAGPLRRCIRGM